MMKKLVLAVVLGVFATLSFAQNTMKFAYFDDYPPLSWVDENKQLHGILVDIATEIGKRMGTEVSNRGYPWARAQDMVRGGTADAFITSSSPERLTYAEMSSEVVYLATFTIFTNAKNPRIADLRKVKTIADLKSFKLGSYIGDTWADANLGKAGIQVAVAPAMSMCLKKLAAGQFDATIQRPAVVGFKLKELGLQNDIVEIPTVLDSVGFRIGISKKSPFAASMKKIDTVIQGMRKDGTLQKIYDAYK